MLRQTLEQQAFDWEQKIKELVDKNWDIDTQDNINQYFDSILAEEVPNIENLVEIQRCMFIFENTKTLAENVIDFWPNGLPLNAKQSLSNLETLVYGEMSRLGQSYNWSCCN